MNEFVTAAPPVNEDTHAWLPSPGNESDDWLTMGWRYQIDTWQRMLLLFDTLRQRATNAVEHEQAGMPPLLDFKYEVLLDARTFAHPANYMLLRITAVGTECYEECVDEAARPVIILDPRAGHGPGIGGFKQDSEVGMAMHEGHPVYFVSFLPEPCPDQTLEDVLQALHRFVDEVSRRHGGQPPLLYGNCQAGWSVVLMSADCAGLLGPAVLNGSPLSYWSGEVDVNPMRLAGGLLGGSWPAHLLADLGDGSFDGAWLVFNFEQLNPANTYWDKIYRLFDRIDEEGQRFLDFERWWNGFYRLGREEILAIVENLFIGNKLERGELQVCPGCNLNLQRIRNPLLIFASSGDNITPPHQALNWIPAVYPDTEALKSAGQRIVYLLNQHIGHLGIFVSAAVARFEHRAILESAETLEALEPGLYEMQIVNPTGDPDCRKPQYQVVFKERRVEELHFEQPQASFEKVRQLSELNESIYSTFFSPWVQAVSTPWSAELMRYMHPLRLHRYLLSERYNPAMAAIEAMADQVRAHRISTEDDNPYRQLERQASRQMVSMLESWRKIRDTGYELMFKALYE